MKVKPWKTIKTNYLLKSKWVNFREETCLTAEGETIENYYILEYRPFVHVIPFTNDGKILLNRQYRHARKLIGFELPGGQMEDTDKAPMIAAKRELLEETGYTSNKIEHLVTFPVDPASRSNLIHFFIAENIYKKQEQQVLDSEVIESEIFTVKEVIQLLEKGEFNQSTHVGGIMLALKKMRFLKLDC